MKTKKHQKMSWIPPVNGRVSAIKSQFENLNTNMNLEPLDICSNNKKFKSLQQQKHNFQFKRSATSYELINNHSKTFVENIVNKIQTNTNSENDSNKLANTRNKYDSLKESNESVLKEKKRKDNDTFLFLSSSSTSQNSISTNNHDAAKENKSNNEVKLSRHTSDPIKRSSIKRSPAFRFGDKQQITNKPILIKQQQLHQSYVTKNEFNDKKLENFILNKCDNIEKLQQPGLTDSMKAALKQPLPNGPPPKKPPRIFSTNNALNDQKQHNEKEINLSSQTINKNKKSIETDDVVLNETKKIVHNSEIKNKIKFLENNLIIKNNDNMSTCLKQQNKMKTPKIMMTKSKTDLNLNNKGGLKFLDFIICHKNIPQQIYNETNFLNSSFSSNFDENFKKDDKEPLIMDNLNNINDNNMLMKKCYETNIGQNQENIESEPIYMEPYGHLKLFCYNEQNILVEENEEEFENEDKVSSNKDDAFKNLNGINACNCSDYHQKNDLHYLCTSIDNSIIELDDSEKDGHLSGKTYDEISILVNVAFQQKPFESKNRNVMCSTKTPTITATAIDNNETIADKKFSTKLCRSLTEKRKDYVRRIASVVPKRKLSTYGTLHGTFKSPVIKTFSLESDDNENYDNICSKNVNNHDNEQENHNKNKPIELNENCNNDNGNDFIMSTNDRIFKYKKLIQENNSSNNDSKAIVKLRNKNDFIATAETSTTAVKTTNINKNDNKIDMNKLEKNESLNSEENLYQKLFQVCILVGYNVSSNCAYIKSKYPQNEPIPDNIEQLIFPSNNLIRTGRENQEYCLILTDDNGFKVYGYCRRVLPEKSETCLPLCYCLISVTKSLGFFKKILKEIESRHGQSDIQMNQLLKLLHNSQIPSAGKFLHIKIPLQNRPKTIFSQSSSMAVQQISLNNKISSKRLSLEANPKWLTESATQSIVQMTEDTDSNHMKNDKKSSGNHQLKSLVQEFEEKKQQQQRNSPFDFGLINRSLLARDSNYDEIFIRRPNDLRLENTELSELLDSLGSELLINVFATLLLERKVILKSSNISLLSKSILALQSILYPFQWQYTIITILPKNLIEICQAPFPILVGILNDDFGNESNDNSTEKKGDYNLIFDIEDGIIVNLDSKKFEQCCGDETTILPDQLRESLHLSLEMVDLIDKGKMLSSVLISEAFLRFFIELFSNYSDNKFYKEKFIQSHQSQNIKFFLEWFVETSMFRNFCNDKYLNFPNSSIDNNDTIINENNDIAEFYTLFNARLMEKSQNRIKNNIHNIENIVKNSKIINKKSKTFKERFKEFLNN